VELNSHGLLRYFSHYCIEIHETCRGPQVAVINHAHADQTFRTPQIPHMTYRMSPFRFAFQPRSGYLERRKSGW
jgi:hypothetical protein